MKVILIAAITALGLTGCPPKAGAPSPILQVVSTVVCPVEQAIASPLGLYVAQQCAGDQSLDSSGYSNCGAAFLSALGAVDLCNQPVPASAQTPEMKALVSVHPEWKVIGDIPASALKGAQGQVIKQAVSKMGIISGIVCPLVVPTILGFLTPVLPPACKCTQSLSSGTINSGLSLACSTATAALP